MEGSSPSYVSNIYDEPNAVGDVLRLGRHRVPRRQPSTAWSHGCVHLTVRNAHYYNQHLPITGAEVVVF